MIVCTKYSLAVQKDQMPSTDTSLPIEVLIISFDGYSDVWDLCISSLHKHWPDCPWKINLLTNSKKYPDESVNSLCVGPDADWSSSLIRGLEKIKSPYVLTLFDDLIIKEKINTDKIKSIVQSCVDNDYNYFRLRPSPPPDGNEHEEYGSLKPGASYRVSLCTSIVKKDTLISLLQSGENAWDFEKFGSLRSSKLRDFYSSKNQLIPYDNAIEKGKWNKSVLPLLAERKIPVEPRGIFQAEENHSSISKIKHFLVFSLMPVFVRKLFYRLQKANK